MSRLAGSVAGRWAAAVCASFAAGAACGFVGAVPRAFALLLGFGAGGFALIAAAAGAGRTPPWAVISAAAVLGLLRGALAVTAPGPARIDGHLGSRPVVIIGSVRVGTPGGVSNAVVDASRVSDADSESAVSGGVLVSSPLLPALGPGDQVEVDASGLRAPGMRPGPESEAILEREDVQAIATAPQVFVVRQGGPSLPRAIAWLQARLVTAVDRALPEPAAALTLGVAFGIHQTLDPAVRTPLQQAGLIHIVVVSGLKVVMILGLIVALTQVLDWSRRRTFLIALVVVSAYVLVSGAGPAAVRSALMAGAALLASVGGRRTDPLPMLALVGSIMLGAAPALVLDPGFQLSFLGTAGILILARPLAARLPGPRILAEPFAVTVAAQIATVPVMAGTFGVVSLVGPVANALVLPLLPAMIVIGGGGALAGTAAPALGWIPLQLAGAGASLTGAIASVLTSVPGAAIEVGTWPVSWTVAIAAAVAAACVTCVVVNARDRHRTP